MQKSKTQLTIGREPFLRSPADEQPEIRKSGREPVANQSKKRTAIFLQTHFVNDYVMALYEKLVREAPARHDVYILYNCNDGPLVLPETLTHLENITVLTNRDDFLSLGYPNKCNPEGWDGKGWEMVPGNCDLPLLIFHRAHPFYDDYWAIEYDVHYQGNWGFFFNRFAKSHADLIGTTIYEAGETPEKVLNPPMLGVDGKPYNAAKAIRGFYPICRVSQRAMKLLNEEYLKGWDGHQEMLLGTILNNNGMEIEDIGGNGPFVKPENRNVFYFNSLGTYSLSPGNFVFRPSFTKAEKKENTLWHPMKPEGDYFKHGMLKGETHWANFMTFRVKPFISKTIRTFWFALVWRKQT